VNNISEWKNSETPSVLVSESLAVPVPVDMTDDFDRSAQASPTPNVVPVDVNDEKTSEKKKTKKRKKNKENKDTGTENIDHDEHGWYTRASRFHSLVIAHYDYSLLHVMTCYCTL
jgi:hypothetical protein